MDELTNKQIAELLSKGNVGSKQLVKSYVNTITKEYKKALIDIKKEIADMFQQYGDDVKYSDMMKYNRLTGIEKQITGILNGINKNVTTTIAGAIKDQFAYTFYHTGYAFESSLGLSLGFSLLNPDVIRAAILNPMDYIKWTDRQKRHIAELVGQIRNEITQGLIKGKGYGDIAKAVQSRTEITAGKSITIVNTETHRAQSMGFNKSFEKIKAASKETGIKVNKVWIATLDDRTRHDHRFMDGKQSDNEGFYYFPEGTTTIAPGLSGIPEEDINCRCTEGIEVAGVNTKYRKDNMSKELINMTNYEEWETAKEIK